MSFTLDPTKPIDPLPAPAPLMLKPGRFNEVENRLSDTEFKAVNFVEQTWWEFSKIPGLEVIESKTGLTSKESKEFWQNEDVLESFRRRGLTPEQLMGDGDLLTREQLIVANMILNIADKRTIREKLKDVSVKPAQYQAWMNDPAFVKYVRTRAEKVFNSTDARAYLALVEGIESGDFASTKLYMEIRGIYNPRVDVNVNVEQVLVRIVDIIERHVSDPEVLVRIANDIEALSGKGPVKAISVASELMPNA